MQLRLNYFQTVIFQLRRNRNAVCVTTSFGRSYIKNLNSLNLDSEYVLIVSGLWKCNGDFRDFRIKKVIDFLNIDLV